MATYVYSNLNTDPITRGADLNDNDLMKELLERTYTIEVLLYMYDNTSGDRIEFNKSDFVRDRICNVNAITHILADALSRGWISERQAYMAQKNLLYRLTPRGCNICYSLATVNVYGRAQKVSDMWRELSSIRYGAVIEKLRGYLGELSGNPEGYEELNLGVSRYLNGQVNEILEGIIASMDDRVTKDAVECLKDQWGTVADNAVIDIEDGECKHIPGDWKGVYPEAEGIKNGSFFDIESLFNSFKDYILLLWDLLADKIDDDTDARYNEVFGLIKPAEQNPRFIKEDSVVKPRAVTEPQVQIKMRTWAQGIDVETPGYSRESYDTIIFRGAPSMYLNGFIVCPGIDFVVDRRRKYPAEYVLASGTSVKEDNIRLLGYRNVDQLPVGLDVVKVDGQDTLVVRTLGGDTVPAVSSNDAAMVDRKMYDVYTFRDYLPGTKVYRLW